MLVPGGRVVARPAMMQPDARTAPSFPSRVDAEAFRLLVESTVDYAIFMLDPEGGVASWNAGARRIKGYEAEEIIGRHFSTFYTPDAVERQWPQFELKEATRVGRFEDEGYRVRKDGSQFWANVVITALRGPDGELRGFAKVTRDLTQRKHQEEQIAALTRELQHRVVELGGLNRELTQRNAENEAFVYSVSHDLRSPLVNLQGFSQELMITADALRNLLSRPDVPDDVRRQAETLVAGDLRESLDYIRNAVRHLGNIIDGLLRLSRVGRVEYESVPVPTTAVVAEILAAMHTSVTEAGARITVGPLPVVRGDRNAIGQVFANLIGNSLKSFSPDRPGEVGISASADQPPVFAVADNGVGIPDAYQPKIFQVFQHVHPAGTRGEGMGLAIVRRIIERHGGRIWFQSRPDHGTTFFFTFGDAGAPGPGAASQEIS
jgi:PAS domain S-box-containing protein